MYRDMYLKFTDEAQADAILYTEVPTEFDERGAPIATERSQNYANIDVLGVLYERAPEDAPEGYEPVPLDGWHVNVRLVPDEDQTPLEPFAVIPTLPRRVWG